MQDQENFDAAVREGLETHLKGVWRFALSLSGRSDIADDLLQATCVRALERSHQVKSTARLDAWFMTICRSIWLNELRSRSVRAAQSLDTTPELELVSKESDAISNIFASEVFSQVMRLPEAQRATVVLVFVQGYSYREAAEILDIPIGTVMSRLSAARGKLRSVVDHAGGVRDAGE